MDKKVAIGVGVVILILIIGGFFIFSNNSSTDTLSKIKTPKTYSGDVSNLILSLDDLPDGYKIAERTPRTKSDVSDKGLSWGWIEGYYIRYIKGNEDNIFDVSRIELSISRYPIENVSKGIEDGYYEFEGYTAEALPNPNVGEGSMATRYTDDELGLREYRIEFYKKDIFITLIAGGTTTDYEMLKELAQKMENKI